LLSEPVFPLDVNTGSSTAAENFPYIMGFEIPALSFAAGSTRLKPFGAENSTDMNTFTDIWPVDRSDIAWRHSDYRDVAYLYTYDVYDNMVTEGGMR